MIIEERNKIQEEREKNKKIFEMLKDIKLPKNYRFVYDCAEIRYKRFYGLINSIVAEISLSDDSLIVTFVDEEELNRLRNCFADSKTKFRLLVRNYYY